MPAMARVLLLVLALTPIASGASPELARWAGRYVDDEFNQVLDIDTRGHVRSTGAMFFGGDAGVSFHAEGTLRPNGQWLTLTLHPSDGYQLPAELLKPQRLLPLVSEGRRFLLGERSLDGIVNNANLQGVRRVGASLGAHELFPGEEHDRPEVRVDADALLPPRYRARLLPKALHGQVTRVIAAVDQEPARGPGSFAVGPPIPSPAGPPSTPRVLRRTTLEIDLGSADGVFVGMILCVSDTYDAYFRVDSLEPHRSTATATTAMTFAVGDAVRSRSLRSAR